MFIEQLLSLLNPKKEMTLQEKITNFDQNQDKGIDYGYGLREDKTFKGKGYFGMMPMTDKSGREFSELSIGSEVDGEEILYPSVVPTLTREELNYMAAGNDLMDRNNPIAKSINEKAYDFAMQRKAEGKPFFALPEEEGKTPMPILQTMGE